MSIDRRLTELHQRNLGFRLQRVERLHRVVQRVSNVATQLGAAGRRLAAHEARVAGLPARVGQQVDVERLRGRLDADHLAIHVVFAYRKLADFHVRQRRPARIRDGHEEGLVRAL